MKRILVLILMLTLLAGCSGGSDPAPTTTVPTTETTTVPTTQTTTVPTTEPVTEPVTEPTEPVVMPYTNPLTGEGRMEPQTRRPYAVVINNIRAAQPLHGIGDADLLFEIVAEGGGSITRLLAVFTDVSGIEKIGSVRSARTYLIDIARAYDGIFVHAGWSEYAQELLRSTHWPFLNGLYGDAGDYYFRDQDRINAGYQLEHTLFTTGDNILAYTDAKSYRTDAKFEAYGLNFAQDGTPDGETANTITLSFYKNGKRTEMNYNAADGCYYGTQHWSSHSAAIGDANTEQKVPFENVFILYARTTTDGYRMFADLVGSGSGYYACGGKLVKIQWSRAGENAPFVYTLADGTPLTQGIGKSYVAIIPNGSPVNYE
jgi:hypothetical protein